MKDGHKEKLLVKDDLPKTGVNEKKENKNEEKKEKENTSTGRQFFLLKSKTEEKKEEKTNKKSNIFLSSEKNKIEESEIKEIKQINELLNEETVDKNLLVDLKIIGKNLEELMLDIDKKLYFNIELKERIEKIEETIKDLVNLIQEVFLTEEKAIIYYLKRNKGKPIKLKELYRRFDKKLVNKIIEELHEKGFIKVLE